MAGGYTHLTLAKELCTSVLQDLGKPGFPGILADVVSNWRKFVYLGAVSPDYPYFGKGTPWADLMHREKTNGVILEAVKTVCIIRERAPEEFAWRKITAWLMGYVSHVIADVVIHPIVNLKVGEYEKNKVDHRECEMHQDVRIYNERVGLDLHFSHDIVQEVQACNDPGVYYADMDDEVEAIWQDCLVKTYGLPLGDAAIDLWHAGFVACVSVAERARKVPLIGRYLMESALSYPQEKRELEAGKGYYLRLATPLDGTVGKEEQPVPGGPSMDFPGIFDKAFRHAREMWSIVSSDIIDGTSRAQNLIGEWSLDTGVDRETGRLRFWS